jgi:glycerol-3-phosphate dehydrogenase (NAD(P)+)
VSRIVILGAGVMGSAMCLPATDRGHDVRLVGTHLDRHIIDELRATGRHLNLKVTLPPGISLHHHDEFAKALGRGSDLIILGVSSAGVGWAIDRLCETLSAPLPVVMITKGLYPGPDTLAVLPDHVASEVKRRKGFDLAIAAVGGPCIAGELAVRRQTGVVITSRKTGFAEEICEMLETGYYHPRSSADVVGVEVCAAFKNFFAIAVGWAAGQKDVLPAAENLAFNHNAAAAIFGQAIAELRELTLALGGSEASAWGMAGAGDLYVTCQAGRNSRLGNNLGRGLTYRETADGPMKGDTIEGAELGIAVGGALRRMMEKGRLDAARLPLTAALLASLAGNTPLDIPWTDFHRKAAGQA